MLVEACHKPLKVMVVTRTCLSPLAPMAAFSAARVGFCQRLLAVSSSGVCFKAVQRPLSRSVPCSFMPVSIISVLIGSRGIFRQFVSMRNQEILHTEHIVLVSLTAVPSESSFQQDPSRSAGRRGTLGAAGPPRSETCSTSL